jgi:AcrR family transcriptional regulator
MEDIAALAGTSRTSVFNYFGYKEALLVEIGARYVREVAERVAPRRARSPRGVMRDLADAVAEVVAAEPVLAKAVAREMVHPDPERRRYAAERMGYPVLYRGLLIGLASKGELRHPKQLPTYERQLVDLTSGAIVRVGGDYPTSQLRAEFYRNIDLFCDGALIPTTGRKQ